MNDSGPAEIRLQLARSHWSLGERDEAIECLLRAAAEDAGRDGLVELVDKFALESDDARLAALQDQLCSGAAPDEEPPSPLHTATMAELLADQGHEARALRVAEDVLSRNPGDERAQAVQQRLKRPAAGHSKKAAALERWLGRIRERGHRGVEA